MLCRGVLYAGEGSNPSSEDVRRASATAVVVAVAVVVIAGATPERSITCERPFVGVPRRLWASPAKGTEVRDTYPIQRVDGKAALRRGNDFFGDHSAVIETNKRRNTLSPCNRRTSLLRKE